jgi:hypothetical protein
VEALSEGVEIARRDRRIEALDDDDRLDPFGHRAEYRLPVLDSHDPPNYDAAHLVRTEQMCRTGGSRGEF